MSLSEEAQKRLADVVELQPTKNRELQERWGLDSGSEVHQVLEGDLKEYYYRDDDSYIRATDEAADLVDVEPGVRTDSENDVPSAIRVPELQQQVFAVIAGPDDRSESVVSVLKKLRAEYGLDPTADEVRNAIQSLKRKGVIEVLYRTVPTYRLVVEREEVDVSTTE